MSVKGRKGGIDSMEQFHSENIWEVLGIEPCHDIKRIRKAYVQISKTVHPEEQPELFLRVKSAYEQAMDYAKKPQKPQEPEDWKALRQPETMPVHIWKGESSSPSVSMEEGTLFHDLGLDYSKHPVIARFHQMYFVRREKSHGKWMEFFTSPAFLQVYFEEGFTKQIYHDVFKYRLYYNCVFVKLYFLAYQVGGESQQHPHHGDELRYVVKILELFVHRGGKQQSATDYAFGQGFADYAALCYYGRNLEENLDVIGPLLGNYFHTCQRVTENYASQRPFLPRLVVSLPLIYDFLDKHPHEGLYALVLEQWRYYQEGDRKPSPHHEVFYRLIEERYPSLLIRWDEQEEAFWDSFDDLLEQLQHKAQAHHMVLVNPFFQKKGAQCRYYLRELGEKENQYLFQGIERSGSRLLGRWIAQNTTNTDLATQIQQWILKHEPDQGEGSQIPHRFRASLSNHHFLRYYLSTAFFAHRDYFQQSYPMDEEWLEEYHQYMDTSVVVDAIQYAESHIMLYMGEYAWWYRKEGHPLTEPYISYDQLSMHSTTTFWKLLPLAKATREEQGRVIADLSKRFTALNSSLDWTKTVRLLTKSIVGDSFSNGQGKKIKFDREYRFADESQGYGYQAVLKGAGGYTQLDLTCYYQQEQLYIYRDWLADDIDEVLEQVTFRCNEMDAYPFPSTLALVCNGSASENCVVESFPQLEARLFDQRYDNFYLQREDITFWIWMESEERICCTFEEGGERFAFDQDVRLIPVGQGKKCPRLTNRLVLLATLPRMLARCYHWEERT